MEILFLMLFFYMVYCIVYKYPMKIKDLENMNKIAKIQIEAMEKRLCKLEDENSLRK
ncbi:hypothetical protein R9X47_15970 [Wukongibacter baidiensis]|uniref:hypothetical protein n=1 Tax=Wukongibacter baidiensis TaxID=1723361 RepID=UPI003D7F3F33